MNDNATYFHIPLETWDNWTGEKKQRYTACVSDLDLDDIKVYRINNCFFWEVDEVRYSPAMNSLPMKLS